MAFYGNSFTGAFNNLSGVAKSGPTIIEEVFGYNPIGGPTGTGGYSTSEVWVADVLAGENAIQPNLYTADATNTNIFKVRVGYQHSADDVLNDRDAIAQIGIFLGDGTLVHAQEFRAAPTVADTFMFGEILMDVPVVAGQSYKVGAAFNGQIRWPEKNPSGGAGSTVYQLPAAQVLEDLGVLGGLGVLSSRTSSWLVPIEVYVHKEI